MLIRGRGVMHVSCACPASPLAALAAHKERGSANWGLILRGPEFNRDFTPSGLVVLYFYFQKLSSVVTMFRESGCTQLLQVAAFAKIPNLSCGQYKSRTSMPPQTQGGGRPKWSTHLYIYISSLPVKET